MLFERTRSEKKILKSVVLVIGFGVCICWAFLLYALCWAQGAPGVSREAPGISRVPDVRPPVTMADVIRMTRLADPLYEAGLASNGLVGNFSPNGAQFVVVLRRGNLASNVNTYSLVLFHTSDVFRSPVPKVLLSLDSSSNRPAISDVKWLSDNDTVMFLGEHRGERTQVYSFKLRTGELKRLTNHNTNVSAFAITTRGDQVAYAAEGSTATWATERALRNGIHVSNELLSDLIRGNHGGGEYDAHELYLQQPVSHVLVQARLRGRIESPTIQLSLSPDGKYLVVETHATSIPKSWKQYSDKTLQMLIEGNASDTHSTNIGQYELIDAHTGVSQILLDAPLGTNSGGSEVAWSPDSKSVILSNTYLPFDSKKPDESALRSSNTFLVEVKVPERQFVVISQKNLRLDEWNATTNVVTCDVGRIASLTGKDVPKIYFARGGNGWVERSAVERSDDSHPQIVLEEDMGTPPRIVAIDPKSHRKALLMDLNPQFSKLVFGAVEDVKWRDTLGNETEGGLYWPRNYITGRKYPLVIQTHGWNRDRFWIDGPWSTAFAAQPLAGKGFFVLQLPDPKWQVWNTAQEGSQAMVAYEGGIDYLDKRGLIDRDRIGIVGFSRSCYYVLYTLTHSKYQFAAAVVADGMDGGYFQYMALSNWNPTLMSTFELLNDGPPLGARLPLWIKRSPEFLMDTVHTPLRIQAIGPTSLLLEWSWFSGLSRLQRPVDFVYIPGGTHVLQKPWDRVVSQEGDVDWFCFWLNHQENGDLWDPQQVSKWRRLREQSQNSP
jgi:dipeptidyl aminopeptidase/acylaminoacyl peptidase